MNARKGMSDLGIIAVAFCAMMAIAVSSAFFSDAMKSRSADPNIVSRVERLEKRVDALEGGTHNAREAGKALAPAEGGEKK